METNTELYKEDFFAWAQATATLIRAGNALAREHASAQTRWVGSANRRRRGPVRSRPAATAELTAWLTALDRETIISTYLTEAWS